MNHKPLKVATATRVLASGCLLVTLASCKLSPPIQDAVTHHEFDTGVFQLVVQDDRPEEMADAWTAAAQTLCSGDFTEFDAFGFAVKGGGFEGPGVGIPGAVGGAAGGLVGTLANEAIKDRGTIKIGYLVCASSKYDLEAAKVLVWGKR